MSVALYITLEHPLPDCDDIATAVDGKALERAQPQLDALAREAGLTPLSEFISVNPEEAADLLEDMGGMPEGMILPAEQWFAPELGWKTVKGLLNIIQRDPSCIRKVAVERVRTDLQDLEILLRAACEQGIRFHLAVDF